MGCEYENKHHHYSSGQHETKLFALSSTTRANARAATPGGGGGGYSLIWAILGMCGPKGYGFSAVLVINRISNLADSGHK